VTPHAHWKTCNTLKGFSMNEPNVKSPENDAADANPAKTSRRGFLTHSAAAIGSVSVAGAFRTFLARAKDRPNRRPIGYGRPVPTPDETTGLKLIALPKGFRYLSFGWTKDPMTGGGLTPGVHDGMAVIDESSGKLTLCRNHELSSDTKPFAAAELSFDRRASGGCTLLTFDASAGKWESARPAISGTVRNCAGGPTDWGSWLTCEETVSGPGFRYRKKVYEYREHHGWVFEVPAKGKADPQPLKEMGRFWHEAVAVDPTTGIVYETEDRNTAGFYRFLPKVKGNLARGGRLQMAKAKGAGDLRRGSKVGQSYDVEWVDIPDPTGEKSGIVRDGKYDGLAVFKQGKRHKATTFARLEGCWYGNRRIYLVATSGGDKKCGQVWSYDPKQETLTLVFESPAKNVLYKPDNITVSPRGGIVLCEDGDGDHTPQRVLGMTPDGKLFPFARNIIQLKGERNGFRGDFRNQEWAGACFSSDGKWLFVNNQTPGITFAITGPWEKGGL